MFGFGLVVLISASAAKADSTVGVDTYIGNSFSTMYGKSVPRDSLWDGSDRTPTGKFLPYPYARADELRTTTSGWTYTGSLEAGALGWRAKERSAQFRGYRDIDNGVFVGSFNLDFEKAESAHFISVTGGGLGRDDQYYTLKFGRYNDWSVRLFLNETPHVFTNTYSSLWTGIGTGNLILLPGLVPGGTTSIVNDNRAVANTINSNGNSTLAVTREKGGLRYDVTLSEYWKGYVSYSLESREGSRPIGAVWGAGGGTAPIELPEAIDYKTHEIMTGLRYAALGDVLDVQLSASIFRNAIDTLRFEEPFRIPNPAGLVTQPVAGAFTAGRLDLYPNNEQYKSKIKYVHELPRLFNGRFTVVGALETSRQNDNLLPYTSVPGIVLANVTGNNWDTTNALSRKTADARIDTRLLTAELSLAPADKLNVRGRARYFETDNKTAPFLACNPAAWYVDLDAATAGDQPGTLSKDGCTGVWGRLLNDGSGSNVLLGANNTATGNIPIASIPFQYRQYNILLDADYRLTTLSTLNVAFTHDIMNRDNREREVTWEDKIKVGYVNRNLGFADMMLRASYEYARRRGGQYDTNAYEDYVSAALIPIPRTAGANVTSWAVHMNTALRKLDLADRDQHTANLRLNTVLVENLTASVSAQMKQTNYPNFAYGRAGSGYQNSYNLDLNYQASSERQLYAFYSFQNGKLKQQNISSTGQCTLGAATALGVVTTTNAIAICGAAGGPIYPLTNIWAVTNLDRSAVYGGGLSENIERIGLLDVNYSYTRGRSKLGYLFAPGGAVTVANAPLAGTGMPDITMSQNMLSTSLLVPVVDTFDVRLIYRYEDQHIDDWHYRGLEASPIAGGGTALPTAIILDGGPDNYHANIIGLMLRFKI